MSVQSEALAAAAVVVARLNTGVDLADTGPITVALAKQFEDYLRGRPVQKKWFVADAVVE